VLAPDGTVVASAEWKLTLASMHPGQRATQRVTVPQPRLWSDRTPELYRLRSALALDGRALDEAITTFGIRQLEFDPDRGLSVNGQPTKLKGVCLHQDAGSFGNAVPAAVWAFRLARLKEMGCNAVRCHYPMDRGFYDACDRRGVVVWQDFWLANPWDGPDPDDNAMNQRNVKDTVLRIRNHASVGL
jgi:beta-galactosidase